MTDAIKDIHTGIADIIKGAYDSKPVDVETAFNNVIQAKMAAAIDARREEIATSIYGDDDEVDETEEIDDTSEEDLETEDSSDEDV